MEDLSMFQRPRTVALEDEKPGTYGTLLIYPLNRLVECGFVGDTAVNPWVGIVCRRQAFARESESLMSLVLVHNIIYSDSPTTISKTCFQKIREYRINLVVTPRAERSSKWRRCRGVKHVRPILVVCYTPWNPTPYQPHDLRYNAYQSNGFGDAYYGYEDPSPPF
ncbi:hypothetical protein PIB30_012030 [Stylosanthes scabra]|uniref:Uncharacterized protein n=1 Tax=Stylosanthes scabra TaxID=79078 RepID=A0ABU6Z4G0_9FABA|nr:hypothetical protein [Stylosanthes scabra]